MKIARKAWSILCFLAIPQFLIMMIIGIVYEYQTVTSAHKRFDLFDMPDIKTILTFAGLACIFIVLFNCRFIGQEKQYGLLTFLETYHYQPPKISSYKREAMYPEIDPVYLSDKPEAILVGKQKGGKKFVRYPVGSGHARSAIILGTPGSGKSTLLLSFLLYMLHKQPKTEEKPTYFLFDVKPELMRKSTFYGDPDMCELSITSKKAYGWDPYYNLSPDSTDDEILEALDVIARALIDGGDDTRNEYFYESARTIFCFMALDAFRDGLTFMQTMNRMLDDGLTGRIEEILSTMDAENRAKVRRGLSGYRQKKGESFEAIEQTFRQSLGVFQRDSVTFFLDENPRKLSPESLEERKSIAFTIPSAKIKDNKTVLRLVVMQIIHHLEQRPEHRHMITLVIDEAYKLGLIRWDEFLAVCRSKEVSCILAFQSLDSMMSVWSKSEAYTLLEMVAVICCLSCNSPDTAKLLCNFAGEYDELKITETASGKNAGQRTRTFERRKILTEKDLSSLPKKQEAVVFLDGEYYRVKTKGARYFEIPELRKISEACEQSYPDYEES